MEDLKRQVAMAQETANKARNEAAQAKTEAMRAKNAGTAAAKEALKARSEASEAIRIATTAAAAPNATEVRTTPHADPVVYQPPFEKVHGGSRLENEAKEDARMNAFFRNGDKVRSLLIVIF